MVGLGLFWVYRRRAGAKRAGHFLPTAAGAVVATNPGNQLLRKQS
jgi:hypothetical protein